MSTRGLSEDAFDEIGRHGRGRNRPTGSGVSLRLAGATPAAAARLEPFAYVDIQADAVHVVVQSLAQAAAEEVMVSPHRVLERKIVVRERHFTRRLQGDPVLPGMQTDG